MVFFNENAGFFFVSAAENVGVAPRKEVERAVVWGRQKKGHGAFFLKNML
ncbi:MAG: hypothetical protein HUK02_08655 [Bacteroidaceae bacterium]|nr:hypothetical protein [Bacteroidaceae bacterium]